MTALCAQSASAEELLSSFGKLAIEHLCDLFAVDLVEDDGSVKRYSTMHLSDGTAKQLATQRLEFPLSKTASYGYPRVIKTGKSQFIPGVGQHLAFRLLSAAKPDDQAVATVRSFICTPLVAHDRTLGALTVANTDRTNAFTADDLLLLEDICQMLAECLDRLL